MKRVSQSSVKNWFSIAMFSKYFLLTLRIEQHKIPISFEIHMKDQIYAMFPSENMFNLAVRSKNVFLYSNANKIFVQ